jgi:hypothetical protein
MVAELRRVWEERVVICFKILFQNLPGGTEETHTIPQSA